MWWWVKLHQSSGEQLGGRGKVVIMDETYFTKRRMNRAGFGGRRTRGHQTCILGIVEIDMITRKEKGKMRLFIIAAPTRVLIEDKVRASVEPGSLIFTDSHKSYNWLGNCGHVHTRVNHTKTAFSRPETLFGVAINITTNPAEGFFGRSEPLLAARESKRLAVTVTASC